MSDKGQQKDIRSIKPKETGNSFDSFVLDKGIFSNVFEKDIRRVYIYKKTERLAKAIHLIAPAFRQSSVLRERLETIAMALVDSATLPPASAREALSRELLALSSVLSIARGNLLSTMNAELIGREAHNLLQEIATYEEPRLFLEETRSLAELFKSVQSNGSIDAGQGGHFVPQARFTRTSSPRSSGQDSVKDIKGQAPQTAPASDRSGAILSILRSRGPSYIKDISTVIRDVSEKTIQRELSSLVAAGKVTRTGERRWTSYSVAS